MAELKFYIILTRNDKATDDERVHISAHNPDYFSVSYLVDGKQKWVIETDYNGLCSYIETLCNSLKYDIIDKWHNIQIQFPMYPILAMPVPVFCGQEFQNTFGKMFDSVLNMDFAKA